MEYAVVAAVALIAAGLTLFSGFGLGTLLLPAFAAFFPPEIAIGATALVHLANNLFKLALVGRDADRAVVLRFGVPAILAALVGALALERLAAADHTIASYTLLGIRANVTPVRLVIGTLIVAFALLELHPRIKQLRIDPRYLPLGGLLSGFFGGLSGHQGALRSAFLIKSGLSRDQFVGTAAVCSALVDLTRLTVYAAGALLAADSADRPGPFGELAPLVAVGCVSAFVGSFVGARLVKKVTLDWVRAFVASALGIFGIAMGAGFL